MPPVNGLLQPTEIRPEVGAEEPDSTPGASTRILSGPRGSQAGSHSFNRILADSARPPRNFQSAGNSSVVTVRLVILTLIILSFTLLPITPPLVRKLANV